MNDVIIRDGNFHLLDCSEPRMTLGLIGDCWEVYGPSGTCTYVSWIDPERGGTTLGPGKEESRAIAQKIVDHLNRPWGGGHNWCPDCGHSLANHYGDGYCTITGHYCASFQVSEGFGSGSVQPGPTATGQQTERSGVPNPEPDGLVTVELTREEAEHAMARGEHPSNAPMIPDFSCPDCKRIAAKFRASLERTGK